MTRFKTISLVALLLLVAAPTAQAALELEPVNVQTSTATATATATTSASTEAYQNAKATYLQAKSDYTAAKTSYQNAKANYQKAKDQENLDLLLDSAKDYLFKATSVAVEYLTTLKVQVENVSNIDETTRTSIINEINGDITWLQGKQTEITNATDKDTLISIANTVKDYWDGVKARAKKDLGEILSSKISTVVSDLDTARTTVQAKIDELKANGQDASDIEALLTKYDEHLNNAKTDLESARNSFGQITSLAEADTLFTQGKEYLEAANRDIRYAYNQLQEIKTELGKKRIYKVDLGGTGSLHAEGRGTANLDGDGTVKASTDTSGTVTISDLAQDSEVVTQGEGTVITIDLITKQYAGYGSIEVTGSDIEVEVKGSELTMDASGTGTASMVGEGTYYIGQNPEDAKAIPVGGIMVNLAATTSTGTSTTDSTTQ